MKLISLNIYGGKISGPLFALMKEKASDTDIFCFQEVLKGGNGQTSRGETKGCYELIGDLLPGHEGYFAAYGDGGYFSESLRGADFEYGVACFMRKDLGQSFVGGAVLYDAAVTWSDYDGRLAAGAACAVKVADCEIVNVHGLWQDNQKQDSEARLEQGQRIIDLANKTKARKIICGDFNLRPDAKSLKMIENLPTRNLIKEYGVKSTRSIYYDKDMKFADYMLVSPEIEVIDFNVLPDEVSDHLAMSLEFQ